MGLVHIPANVSEAGTRSFRALSLLCQNGVAISGILHAQLCQVGPGYFFALAAEAIFFLIFQPKPRHSDFVAASGQSRCCQSLVITVAKPSASPQLKLPPSLRAHGGVWLLLCSGWALFLIKTSIFLDWMRGDGVGATLAQMQRTKRGAMVCRRRYNLAGSNQSPSPSSLAQRVVPTCPLEDTRARPAYQILPRRLHQAPTNFWLGPLSRRWRLSLNCTW